MITDPTLDEMRAIRDAHAKQFNYDLNAIYADIRRYQRQLKTEGWKFARPTHRWPTAKKLAA